jgi:hypothetical protein
MVIAIDPGDIRKKYAKKMGFFGRVCGGLCGIIWPVGNVTSRIVTSSSVTSLRVGRKNLHCIEKILWSPRLFWLCDC